MLMKTECHFFVIVSVLLFACVGYASADESMVNIDRLLTPENTAKLVKGEAVLTSMYYKDERGKTRTRGAAIVIVDRTTEEVWKHLDQFEEYPLFMPRMTSAAPYFNEGNRVGVEFTLKVVFKTIRYSIMHTIDKDKGILTLNLDKSKENDIRSTNGEWLVKPYGQGKSLVFHSVTIDTGMAVPVVIMDYLTKKDLPNIVFALKQRVEAEES